MTAKNFSACMKRILAYEGGYSNHPKDPGGVTLEGVIQRVYDGYRKNKGQPLKALTASMRNTVSWKAERDDIYRIQYWNKVRGDELPAGVDLVVFDGAVNSGPVQSIKWLQRALKVQADGAMGVATMAALDSCQDYDLLIADICARRLAFLKQLRTWGTFGNGWGARVSNVMATGQAWASGSIGPKPAPVLNDNGAAKAVEADLAQAPVSVGAGATVTTAGTVLSGAADQVQGAATAIGPLADTVQIVKYVVLALTLIAAGLMLYGIWRSYKVQRARNGEDKVAVLA